MKGSCVEQLGAVHQLRRGIANPVLTRSAAVVVREGGECSLWFPGHVGVGVAEAVFENLDHTLTGHVEVFAGRCGAADRNARRYSRTWCHEL